MTHDARGSGALGLRPADALAKLKAEGVSLLVLHGEQPVYRAEGHGIGPLLRTIAEVPANELAGARFIDRVVGRAAALLLAHVRAASVVAGTMSDGAVRVLTLHRIPFAAGQRVAKILGRAVDAPCPFEASVEGVDDPSEAVGRIVSVQEALRKGSAGG